jgi:hypothetical protein
MWDDFNIDCIYSVLHYYYQIQKKKRCWYFCDGIISTKYNFIKIIPYCILINYCWKVKLKIQVFNVRAVKDIIQWNLKVIKVGARKINKNSRFILKCTDLKIQYDQNLTKWSDLTF